MGAVGGGGGLDETRRGRCCTVALGQVVRLLGNVLTDIPISSERAGWCLPAFLLQAGSAIPCA